MRSSSSVLVAAAAAVAGFTASASASASSNITCVDGLYMIVARGTDEPAPVGSMGKVADDVASSIPNSKVVGVSYPATFSDYFGSEYDGATDLSSMVTAYHDKCPKGKMALFGYSQGAQLTADAVCGGTEESFKNVSALPMKLVKDSIVAIVLFGDPSHIANTTYDRGTSVHDGIFDRRNDTLCEDYSNELISYCDKGDVYCDAGQNSTVHGLYVQKYGKQAAQYVIDKYHNSTASSGSGSGSSSASGSATMSAPSGTATGSASKTASGTHTAASATHTGAASRGVVSGLTVVLGSSLCGFALSML